MAEKNPEWDRACLYASLNATKPNSAVEYMMRSSAMRLMCVMERLAHIKNSTMKSRSLTPYMLFSATDWNPSSFARNSRSTPKGLPARAPEPRGSIDTRGMSCCRRSKSARKENACERRKCDHRMGWPRCKRVLGLCGVSAKPNTNLQVSVAGHEDILLLVRAFHHHADEVLQTFFDSANLPEEPQAHVRGDLVVARAAGVELSAKRTDKLGEAALVRSVDVLVVGLDLELHRE